MSIFKDPSIWHFPRKKKKNIFLSIIYRVFTALPFSKKTKFLLFSNLSWIFKRMANESSEVGKLKNYVIYDLRDKFIKHRLSKNDNLIDLGCGSGVISRLVAPHVKSVIAVDYDKDVLEIAKNLINEKNITYVNKDIFKWLSNSSEKYEIAICSHVIEHLDDPRDFLNSCKFFFKYIFIEVPDNDQDEQSFLRVANGLEPLFNDADHIWEFKRKDLASLFNDLNFEVIDEQKIHGVMRFWLKC